MTGRAAMVVPDLGATSPPAAYGPLTRTDFVKYQGASGDFNPIHHDEPFARAAGFPVVFSVGMLQAGFLAAHAVDWLGPENIRRFAVRFREQCWPGDVVTCTATVTGVKRVDTHHRVEVAISGRRQTGDVAVEAVAEFEISQEPVG